MEHNRIGWVFFFAFSCALQAADFTWLNAPASGLWNTNDVNWSGAGTVWANGATNNATFGASTAQALTADAVTLSNLTFSADGYSIGGGPLLMYGRPAVSNGFTATITAAITNVGVWGLYTSGTVVLNPGTATNFFYAFKAATGAVIQVTGGTNLVTQSGSDPENSPAFWVNGGTLVVGGGLLKTVAGPYARVSEYGTLLVTNGVCDLSSNGELLNAFNSPGTTTVGGNGVLILDRMRIVKNNVGANYSFVNINAGGTIYLNEFEFEVADANRKATMNLNGGTIKAKDFSTTRNLLGTTDANWSNILVNVLSGGAIFDNNGCNFNVYAKLRGTSGDGGLTKMNSGAMNLRGTNTYNGPTVMKGGAINIVGDFNLGTVPSTATTNLLFLSGSTLQSSANNALAANRTIWVTNSVTATFDPQTYTQMIYGTILCADTSSTFYKVGSGVVVLDPGPTAVNTFGTLQETAGTLVIASGTNLVTRYCGVQNGPGLRINGGTLLVAGGVLKTTSGSLVNVDGGHLLVTNGVADTLSCSEILNGIASTFGYTTVGGSGKILANQIRITQNPTSATNNVVTVNAGGTLSVGKFYIDTNFTYQAGMLVLNGGTVQARNDTPDFLGTTATLVGNANDKWLTNIFVRVREGGAVFDTAGHAISIKQPLCSDVTTDGGLTKTGLGSLTLLNTNVYSGATTVAAGTLTLGAATNTLLAGGTVWVSSNAVFDANGKVQSLAALGGSGTVSNNASLTVTGLVAPGGTNAVGTLTLASACPLSGEMRVDVSATGACDRLTVQGSLDLSGLSLTLANADQLNKDYRYVFVTYAGSLSGAFASVSLPKRWSVQYDAPNRRVYLIYNRGTLITLQ